MQIAESCSTEPVAYKKTWPLVVEEVEAADADDLQPVREQATQLVPRKLQTRAPLGRRPEND